MKLIVTEKGEASRRQAKSHELAIINSLEEARLLETDGAENHELAIIHEPRRMTQGDALSGGM